MNALLDRERRNIERARERAGDLAHGFKTPLAVLSAVSRDLERDGRAEAAREIETQIDMMGRHVQRELACTHNRQRRCRARHDRGRARHRSRDVGAAAHRRRPRTAMGGHRRSGSVFPGDENDLLEIVGNLAENAAKWAKSTVLIAAEREGRPASVGCADDGPGIQPGRGGTPCDVAAGSTRRRDGSGLGLSIVDQDGRGLRRHDQARRSAIGGLAVRSDPDARVAASQSSSK